MKNKTPKFENRVRFNWGYHDAAQAVREGWVEAGKCFGSALPALQGATTPEQVIAHHPDRIYAEGWAAGYRDAKAGTYAKDSEAAWLASGLAA